MSRRSAKLAWAKREYTNPHKHKRTIGNMLPEELRRLDQALTQTTVPISAVAKRFNLTPEQTTDRLHELGYRAGVLQRFADEQERIPLQKESK